MTSNHLPLHRRPINERTLLANAARKRQKMFTAWPPNRRPRFYT
ncbi:MAG TPA: hypothetical protein VGM41_06680 [Chitinophagaceae bacterium]